RMLDGLWVALVAIVTLAAVWMLARFIAHSLTWQDGAAVFGLGLLTLARVALLIAIASLIWVPIGVWIGLRPVWAERLQPVAQFLAAFP
ncbi:sulfonate ABC transporter permease, partial [Salmonella enterica subsp. enterica serovar Istanbul]|nr:sulfonate ABC transporter permease [Salmonella enterica subsp. enterica serovar Istanbul]